MRKIFTIIILVMLFAGCKKDNNPVSTPTNKNEKVELGTNSKPVENDPNLSSVTVDSNKITLSYKSSNSLPTIKAGDILLGQTNDGYLRKVQSVSVQSNVITATTTKASLDEAYTKLRIDTSLTFSPSLQKVKAISINTKIGNFLYKAKSSEPLMDVNNATGEMILNFPNVSFEIALPDGSGKFLLTADNLKISLIISLDKFHINVEELSFGLIYKVINTQTFTNVKMILHGNIVNIQFPDADHEGLIPNDIFLGSIPIGIPPVVLPLNFYFNVAGGIIGNFHMSSGVQLTNSMTTTSTYRVGAELSNGSWNGVWEKSTTGNSDVNINPVAGISGEVRIFIKPQLKTKLCGVAGPGLYVGGFGYGEVNYPPLTAACGFGLNGGLNFIIEILTKKIVSYSWNLAEYKWPLWQKTFSNLPPSIPSNPNPTDKATNQPTALTLSWTCSDPENDPLQYDVYLGQQNPPTTKISALQSSKSYNVTGLTNNTTYYWHVYAKDDHNNFTESMTWSFITKNADQIWDSVGTLTDIDGNIYKTVKIGNQWWMAENLKVTHYADGTLIEDGTGKNDNIFAPMKYWWVYNDEIKNKNIYGLLYSWTAAMNGESGSVTNPSGVQGAAPHGWHIPSDAEWKELEIYLGMSQVDADKSDVQRGTDEGNKLKETGSIHWKDFLGVANGGTNSSGFAALPGGFRNRDGAYDRLNYAAFFWTTTNREDNSYFAYDRFLYSHWSFIVRSPGTAQWDKSQGFSVRCVKNR